MCVGSGSRPPTHIHKIKTKQQKNSTRPPVHKGGVASEAYMQKTGIPLDEKIRMRKFRTPYIE